MDNKRSTKGIHRETMITHDQFLKSLYTNSELRTQQNRMAFNKSRNEIDIIQQNKLALNSCYVKLYVNDDLVTVTPLKKDNNIV